MNLILTMNGKYQRFREQGYNIPKYLLPWRDRTILWSILYGLTINVDRLNVFLVANKSDEAFFNHVLSIMGYFGISKDHLIVIGDTTGQAQTAYRAIFEINTPPDYKLKGPVLFHNIDTILRDRNLTQIESVLQMCDCGYIDVFQSQNHEYSYAIIKDDLLKSISEKVLISDQATSGLYGFSSARLYQKYFEHEIYISEVYKKMISASVPVYAGPTYYFKEKTIVLGTPEQYLQQSRLLVNYHPTDPEDRNEPCM